MFFIVNLNETRAIIGSKSGKGGKLMDEKWQQLKEWIQESQYIVFFGGAGVSTESKIPDFRSEDGLYRQKYKYPPETIISHSFYMIHGWGCGKSPVFLTALFPGSAVLAHRRRCRYHLLISHIPAV